MILPDINVKVHEVVVPIDQFGWNIRIDHNKGRTSADVMAVLNKWLLRWARRRGKWLINEARLKWERDYYADRIVTYLKWAACDAPPGQPKGLLLAVPPAQKTITLRTLVS